MTVKLQIVRVLHGRFPFVLGFARITPIHIRFGRTDKYAQSTLGGGRCGTTVFFRRFHLVVIAAVVVAVVVTAIFVAAVFIAAIFVFLVVLVVLFVLIIFHNFLLIKMKGNAFSIRLSSRYSRTPSKGKCKST